MSLSPETLRLLRLVHAAASSKHAKEPVALDVTGLSSITDALYVCHADSTRAVQAVVEGVTRALSDAGLPKARVEGLGPLQWVLLDLGDVMAHVFLKERREYYTLERLWHDAPRVSLEAA